MKINLKKIVNGYLEASNVYGKIMADYYYQCGSKDYQKHNKTK